MKTFRKIVMIALIAVLGVTGFTACGNGSDKYEVVVAGSTSVQPLMEKLIEKFEELQDGVEVKMENVTGSGAGITDAKSGVADIGMVSRELKDSEKADFPTAQQMILALDGIAVIVHKNNAFSDVSFEELAQIYKGTKTEFSEGKAISVNTREAGSGTRGAFFELIGIKDTDLIKGAAEFNSTGNLKTAVAGDEKAIGFVSLGAVDSSVKALKVGGVEATVANVVNTTYKLFRPFNLVRSAKSLTSDNKDAVNAFISFLSSKEAHAIIAKDFIVNGAVSTTSYSPVELSAKAK